MLILQGVTYIHPDRDLLFGDLNLTIHKHDKIALIGNNGSGKSTLLKILSGSLQPTQGKVNSDSTPYYVPQHFGQYDSCGIAEALQIDQQLEGLYKILNGDASALNFSKLNGDWAIEARCAAALANWKLEISDLNIKMHLLSGGQKTRVFLAGIQIHQPEIVLMDEPSNHLDAEGRTLLYEYITTTNTTLVIVSHDRALLNLMPAVYELNKDGISGYRGNYESFVDQKMQKETAIQEELKDKEKALKKARQVERAAAERQQRLDARGKKKQEKAGLPKILMNTLKNNAEKSTSKLKDVHAEKINGLSSSLIQLRTQVPETAHMKVILGNERHYRGKLLIEALNIDFNYNNISLWPSTLNVRIFAGDRVALKGNNGSGKTTLINIILGKLTPSKGSVTTKELNTIYIDQDYSLIDPGLSVYEQAQKANSGKLEEHEIKIRLSRFLFDKNAWNKPCSALSGGERLRLILCSLTIASHAPELIVLDEPTNNLDLQNIEILTKAIQDYTGTLIVVSHDDHFLEEIGISATIAL